MITQLQITHKSTPYDGAGAGVVGLSITARLFSPSALFTEIYLKLSSAKITIRSGGLDGYINLIVPVSYQDSEIITSRVDGSIELKINNISSNGAIYTVETFEAKIDDFRYDIGAMSSKYTLVLREDFSTPIKTAIVQTEYSAVRKLAYTGAKDNYIYSVDPLMFRYYSIGASFTEGSRVGVIDTIELSLSNKNINLDIGILV